MDTDNLVVKLCIEGMQAETEGRSEEARKLFEQAWDTRKDDYDACVAAHYLAGSRIALMQYLSGTERR